MLIKTSHVMMDFIFLIVCSAALLSLVNGRAARVKRDEELRSIGLHGLKVIGTRFINEHHEVHDYPEHEKKDSSSEDSDYHHAIYDHAKPDKDDYSDFGDPHDKHSDQQLHDDSDSHEHGYPQHKKR